MKTHCHREFDRQTLSCAVQLNPDFVDAQYNLGLAGLAGETRVLQQQPGLFVFLGRSWLIGEDFSLETRCVVSCYYAAARHD